MILHMLDVFSGDQNSTCPNYRNSVIVMGEFQLKQYMWFDPVIQPDL